MSHAHRTAAALKRAQWQFDNASPPEEEDEGEEVDVEQSERDREAQQCEQLWQQGERG